MDYIALLNHIGDAAHNATDICPHCGVNAHIQKLWEDSHSYENGALEFYIVFRCAPCGKLVLKTFIADVNGRRSGDYQVKGWKEKFPLSLDSELSPQEFENLSPQVLADYKEALRCKSIKANKASCSMFRRALQASLIELGANAESDLIEQINSLDSLPKDLKDWAHQIRIFGNWGAHPNEDKLKDISESDVSDVHEFIANFFSYTFIMPNKVEASRKRREEQTKKRKF